MSARQRPNKDLKKDLSVGFLQQTCLCLPSISGAPGCGPGLVRGTRLSACRICCLFTISNIRAAHRIRGGHEPHLTFRRRSSSIEDRWWSLSGSNRRPEACKATALPAELRPLGEAKVWFGLKRRRQRPLPWLPRASARAPVRACDAGASDLRPLAKADQPPATFRRAPRQDGGPGTTRTSDLTLIRGAL
jgi:hypothetical protein